jgi:hypothetical protein
LEIVQISARQLLKCEENSRLQKPTALNCLTNCDIFDDKIKELTRGDTVKMDKTDMTPEPPSPCTPASTSPTPIKISSSSSTALQQSQAGPGIVTIFATTADISQLGQLGSIKVIDGGTIGNNNNKYNTGSTPGEANKDTKLFTGK